MKALQIEYFVVAGKAKSIDLAILDLIRIYDLACQLGLDTRWHWYCRADLGIEIDPFFMGLRFMHKNNIFKKLMKEIR